MGVYRVASLYGTEYFNTKREACQRKPGGEEPETIERLDAAGECNRLEKEAVAADRQTAAVRRLLEDLWGACSLESSHAEAVGRRVAEFFDENPLPRATAADRDGQRSYGV